MPGVWHIPFLLSLTAPPELGGATTAFGAGTAFGGTYTYVPTSVTLLTGGLETFSSFKTLLCSFPPLYVYVYVLDISPFDPSCRTLVEPLAKVESLRDSSPNGTSSFSVFSLVVILLRSASSA